VLAQDRRLGHVTQTTRRPSDRCRRCLDGLRRYVGTRGGGTYRYFHHVEVDEFEDCEDQTDETS